MVGAGVWALLRWLTYSLMAMATVWRRGHDVEEAPSRTSRGQVGSGRVKPGVESSRVPSEYHVSVVRSGPGGPARCGSKSRSGRVDPSRQIECKSHQSHQHHIEKVPCASDACEREEGGKKGSDGRTVRGHQLKQHVSVEQRERCLRGERLLGTKRGGGLQARDIVS